MIAESVDDYIGSGFTPPSYYKVPYATVPRDMMMRHGTRIKQNRITIDITATLIDRGEEMVEFTGPMVLKVDQIDVGRGTGTTSPPEAQLYQPYFPRVRILSTTYFRGNGDTSGFTYTPKSSKYVSTTLLASPTFSYFIARQGNAEDLFPVVYSCLGYQFQVYYKPTPEADVTSFSANIRFTDGTGENYVDPYIAGNINMEGVNLPVIFSGSNGDPSSPRYTEAVISSINKLELKVPETDGYYTYGGFYNKDTGHRTGA